MNEQIQKYYFNGHLSPRPPGTEQAMCSLGGYVYLASEADKRLAEAGQKIRSLEAQVKALKRARRTLNKVARGGK